MRLPPCGADTLCNSVYRKGVIYKSMSHNPNTHVIEGTSSPKIAVDIFYCRKGKSNHSGDETVSK